ncbi:MAG TPA: hypothetical protein VF169_04180 [Albitalea sp.]|uniref:hypothetical protein n=1 Tax=Piscinibacter sp. TaxID=1903157 RepID=UPI002ED3E6B9
MKRVLVPALLLVLAAATWAQAGKKRPPAPLSREELRQCMDREDQLIERRDALGRARAEHDTDLAAATQAAGALSSQLRTLDNTDAPAVDGYNKRIDEHDLRVGKINKRAEALNAAAGTLQSDGADFMAQCSTRPFVLQDKQSILKEKGRDAARPRAVPVAPSGATAKDI